MGELSLRGFIRPTPAFSLTGLKPTARATLGEQRLSAREDEVAACIARGLSNKEIAAELVITEGTAANHVEHILNKLVFQRRTQIAAWVTERRAQEQSEA
ncbi:MAG: LuxR family transcriptional regulator fused with ATPase domain [Chloroflexi bacterium]|nr:LuxR family transcriptional regulator fused with ATPase domain [Chloroflexota bacterium]